MNFSFLIVNLNGEANGVLKRCLLKIKELAPKNSQVIVCDNGSTDNSIELAKSLQFNDLKIIENKKNIGPSHARYIAMKYIKNEITFILDNDAYLEKVDFNYISRLYKNKKNLAIIQPLILIEGNEKVDYFGDFLTFSGFLKQKHEPLIEFKKNTKDGFILSAKAAGMIIRTRTLFEVGGFDPFYNIYVEESDLGWKCWLKGKYNISRKKIIVKHGYGSTTKMISKKRFNKNVFFYGPRNYLIMNFTNLEFSNLIYIFPFHLILWICFSTYCCIVKFEFRRFYYQLSGIFDFFVNFGLICKKRNKIQRERILSDKKIFKKILKKFSLFEFYVKATRRPKVGNLSS